MRCATGVGVAMIFAAACGEASEHGAEPQMSGGASQGTGGTDQLLAGKRGDLGEDGGAPAGDVTAPASGGSVAGGSTMVLSGVNKTQPGVYRRINGVTMKPKGIVLAVDFGCTFIGDYDFTVFLDDDEDAPEGLTRSTDAADSCPKAEALPLEAQITFGRQTTVELTLDGSCDPEARSGGAGR